MANDPNKLAYSSQCVPGSAAELKEKERLAEFHRQKALRKAEEERVKPAEDAKRHEEYLRACEKNDEKIRRDRADRAARNGYLPRM